MPATLRPSATLSSSPFNYCFLLKCLAGVALCAFIISMLMRPTYIVVAAAATLAPMAASAIFFPLVALLALATIVALAASISFSSSAPVRGPNATTVVAHPWYSVPYWFGPRYVGFGWNDYFWGRQPNYRASVGSTIHTSGYGVGHVHGGSMFNHQGVHHNHRGVGGVSHHGGGIPHHSHSTSHHGGGIPHHSHSTSHHGGGALSMSMSGGFHHGRH